MKIAIPVEGGVLCAHFGHCQHFAIIEVDEESKKIVSSDMMSPPPHEPGVLPSWLSRLGCTVIIAGGMGGRAMDMFTRNGVEVVIGAPVREPEEIVRDFLNNRLTTSGNPCDEQGHHGEGHCRNRERS